MRHYDAHELIKFVMNEETDADGCYTDEQKQLVRIIRRGKTYQQALEVVYGTTK